MNWHEFTVIYVDICQFKQKKQERDETPCQSEIELKYSFP